MTRRWIPRIPRDRSRSAISSNACAPGAEKFGWSRRNATPGTVREKNWLIGIGVAGAVRDSPVQKSAARVRLDSAGRITVETDMTDIGTGTYTIIAQTAAETMGVPLEQVIVKLGDSSFPVSAGSGGQWGANSSTSGVYAACVKLREAIAKELGVDPAKAEFAHGEVREGKRAFPARTRRARARAGRGGCHRVRRTPRKRTASTASARTLSKWR